MMHDEVPGPPRAADKGWWEWIFRVPGLILGQWGYISVYGFPSVTLGAFLAYAGVLVGRPFAEIPLLMLVGMAAYLPFLSYYFRPEEIVERKFKQWDRWVERRMITSNQRKEMRRDLLNWYQEEVKRSLPQSGKLPLLVSPQPVSQSKSPKKVRDKI
jgi:hypothetical protein